MYIHILHNVDKDLLLKIYALVAKNSEYSKKNAQKSVASYLQGNVGELGLFSWKRKFRGNISSLQKYVKEHCKEEEANKK